MTAVEQSALLLSLRVATVAVLGSLLPAVAVAFTLARWRSSGRLILAALVYLPLVLPPVVTGYGLLILLGKHGVIGGWLDRTVGVEFAFRWTGAAVASAVMGFPLLVRAVQLGFEAVDRRLEAAASGLGAPPWAVFLTVTLPLALPALLAGAAMSFAKSLGEFGATITFVSNIPGETETLPIAIYALLQVPGQDAPVLRLAMISIAASVIALTASELIGRRLDRHTVRM